MVFGARRADLGSSVAIFGSLLPNLNHIFNSIKWYLNLLLSWLAIFEYSLIKDCQFSGSFSVVLWTKSDIIVVRFSTVCFTKNCALCKLPLLSATSKSMSSVLTIFSLNHSLTYSSFNLGNPILWQREIMVCKRRSRWSVIKINVVWGGGSSNNFKKAFAVSP